MRMVDRVRKTWTVAELYTLPEDGNKYELVHGELFVTPAPTVSHETILARLTRLLDPYVAANALGFVYRARAVVAVSDQTEVEPDLMVRQPPDDMDAGWRAVPLPTLVIEVTSDSTRRRDRVHKRNLYAELGIPEYWIADRADRSVRIVRLGQPDVVATESIAWHPAGVRDPLSITIADVFGPPLGDRSSDHG
jgi:Uma2 family endonuclease